MLSQAITSNLTRPPALRTGSGAVLAVLLAISSAHLINDLLQALVPASYPLLKSRLSLSFGQIGAITLVNQLTASILQPVIGTVTDRRPMPFALPFGMASTLAGLLLLSVAGTFPAVLCAAALIGVGSSVFHPEASRVTRTASGGRHGFAQSVFQVGGNAGAALGPLMAAFVIASHGTYVGGQTQLAWFALAALLGIIILSGVSLWIARHAAGARKRAEAHVHALGRGRVAVAMTVLVALMLSKFFYMASIGNYYQFYLISRFALTLHNAQLCQFLFALSFAAGTLAGGPIGDRIGRKQIIWMSILGALPFTLALPYAGLTGTVLLTIPIGLLLASAFPAIVVYAQELMPGRVGAVSGLMFGVAFGLGGIGAATLGMLADHTSIIVVFKLCAFLPAIGLLAGFLPSMKRG